MSTQAAAAQETPLFVAAIGVRWRDMDAFNHVNNSTYLTYLEEARLQWMQHAGDSPSDEALPVLAASQLQYRQPIAWPASLRVELRCGRVGNSSITLEHRIVDAADTAKLYCDGHVVMVWVNPATGAPVPLPAAVRAAAGGAKG